MVSVRSVSRRALVLAGALGVAAGCVVRAASASPLAARLAPAPTETSPPSSALPTPASPRPTSPAARAREHHARALAHYDAREYGAALSQLQRAYALEPRYEVLFNIGQLEFLLGHHAHARGALERYLGEGGARIAEQRRAEVTRQLRTLEQRTAQLAVSVDVDGARVRVQGEDVGISPLPHAVFVEPGRVRVRVSKAGRGALERNVQARAGQSLSLWLELGPASPAPPAASGPSPLVVAGWVATGALGLGAAGSFVAAELGARRYRELLAASAAPGGAESHRVRLDEQRARIGTLATASDALALAALAAGALSLYFTLQPSEPASGLSLGVSPSGAFAAGSF